MEVSCVCSRLMYTEWLLLTVKANMMPLGRNILILLHLTILMAVGLKPTKSKEMSLHPQRRMLLASLGR